MHRLLSVRLLLLVGVPAIVFIATVLVGTQLAAQHEKGGTAAAHEAFAKLVDRGARHLKGSLDAVARDTALAAAALAEPGVLDRPGLPGPLAALLTHHPALAVASVVGPDQLPRYASLRPFDKPDPLKKTLGLAWPPTATALRPHWSFRRPAHDDAQLVRHDTAMAADGTPGARLTVALGARDLDALLRALHPGPESTWLLLGPDGRLAALAKTPGASDDDSPLVAGLLIRDPSVTALLGKLDTGAAPADGVFDLTVEHAQHLGRSALVDADDFTVRLGAVAPRAAFVGPLDRGSRDDVRRALLVALVAAVLAFGVARSITGPLDAVADELEEVAALHPDPPRATPRYREFATIQDAVDHVRRTQRSFMSYVPREVVHAIGTSGRAARLEGETRELSILFTDAQGFTQWAQDRRPEELVVELGRYLTQICDEVTRHDGTVDKFLGDGVVAFWGAPHRQPDHAFMSVSAALAARQRLASRAEKNDPTAFPTRFGLATGPVLVGNIGTPDRLNYTILGDTANYAARLEALNKRYGSGILISEATAEAVRDRIVVRPVDLVTVQGRSRAERVYQPLCLASDPHASRFEDVASLTEDALNAYVQRQFARAASLYAQLLIADNRDGPARILLERCQVYDRDGVPTGWDGVEHTTK